MATTKPVLEWEIQKQQHFGGVTIWANNGALGLEGPDRGVHNITPDETPEGVARGLIRKYLPKDSAYRVAVWDTLGVGKPPILLGSWDADGRRVVRDYAEEPSDA